MKRLISLFASLVVPVFMLTVANPVMAQDKAKDAMAQKATNTTKVLQENDQVRVVENTTKPGEMSGNVVRGLRVIRILQGGTQERIWADGKKEKLERKTGEVIIAGPDKQAYVVKNIGKTTIVSYVVQIKEAKK